MLRKSERFHVGEINNKVEDSIVLLTFFVISKLENLLNSDVWYAACLKDVFIM